MAKKEQTRERSRSLFSLVVPKLLTLVVFLSLGLSAWVFWDSIDGWVEPLHHYIENRDVVTLEAKMTPEEVMEVHRQELLGIGTKRVFQGVTEKYYPYLLLDVKYTEDDKTREGVLLWSLVDGEAVLNCDTWETTRGLRDCLQNYATQQDFRILHTLAKNKGVMSLDALQATMQVDKNTLDSWLEKAKQKHLIAQQGNQVFLHFENPKLLLYPQTIFSKPLASKTIDYQQRVAKTFSRSEILTMSHAAFGSDFGIRREREIFLPVYTIHVQNPDGSIYSTDWSALTGMRMQL